MNAPLSKQHCFVSSDEILSKITPLLKGVIKRHNGGYLAFCPSHDDRKGRSLAIGAGRQGQAILKCFAGCSIHEITAAIGLNLSDLFPKSDQQTYNPQTRSYFNEWQILSALQHDAIVVLLAARWMLTGKALPGSDIDFLSKAVIRINEAVSCSRRFK